MKPRDSTRQSHLGNGIKKIGEDISPVYNSSHSWLKNLLEKNPKRSLIIMLSIVVVNFSIGFYFVLHRSDKGMALSSIKSTAIKTDIGDNSGYTGTFSDYLELKKMKDSMDYLMNKRMFTKTDTLLFIRLVNRYNALDSEARQMMAAPHE